LLEGVDQSVLRGSTDTKAFLLFHLRAGSLAAVESVNMARDFLACRKLVAQAARIAPEQLTDPTVALASLG